MLAAIDNLIGLVIFLLIAAISSWLKRRQGGQEEGEPMPPPPRRSRPAGLPQEPPVAEEPAKPLSWEEELRRLLEGQPPETQAPPAPPPVIVESPRPAPMAAPPPLPETPAHRHRSVFDVIEEKSPVELEVEPDFRPLPELTESAQAYQRASQLGRTVEEHLREVTEHRVGTTSVQRKAGTPEAVTALAWVRHRQSLRSALLTSIILGPPRALADEWAVQK
jgi:hypothetical protein